MSGDGNVAPGLRNASIALVAYCVVISLVSNGVFGRGIGNASCSYTQRFSPSGPAFGIWLPIYILSGLLILEQSMYGQTELDNIENGRIMVVQNAFYSVSWLCAAGWTPAFTAGTATGMLIAAILLCLTAAFALAAVFSEGRWSWSSWVTAAAYSSLAGWTTVAAAINVSIAYQANYGKSNESCSRYPNDYNIFSPIEAKYETVVPLILAVTVSVVAASLSEPVLGMPVAWAIYFMRPSYYNYAAFVISLIGVVVALARTLYSSGLFR
jgi:hypothetical protein